jgi:hypothetical protein
MILDVAALSDDELELQLATWAGRLAAGEGQLLVLLGELDVREGWAQIGVLSCAHWAAWKLGLTLPTAREKVRVARSLRDLPQLTARMSAGRVSYAQVRAITRVATAADEGEWIELARHTTAAQLEKASRGVDRCRQDPKPAHEQPPAVTISWDDDGSLLLTIRISPHEAPAVLARLEQARAAEQTDRDKLYTDLATDLVSEPDVSAETPAAPPTGPRRRRTPSRMSSANPSTRWRRNGSACSTRRTPVMTRRSRSTGRRWTVDGRYATPPGPGRTTSKPKPAPRSSPPHGRASRTGWCGP